MTLSADQITNNWSLFLENISKYIPGERGDKLYAFYDKYANRFALMPASGKTSYHNAFAGGYVDHVNRVLDLTFKFAELWNAEDVLIPSQEELAFVAINHDLGKFGDLEHEEYLVEEDNYWLKKGQIYKHNPEISFMKTSERSLFLLQQIGVTISADEYLGIKLHDGLYEEANKSYYISFSEEYRLRSNLAYIVHQADLLATRIEHDGINKSLSSSKNKYFNKILPESESVLITSGSKMIKRPVSNTSTTKTLKEHPDHGKSITKVQGGKYAALLNKL